MFTPMPEDVQIFVEAHQKQASSSLQAGLRSDQCWRLRNAMNRIRVSSRFFQDHLASILRAGGFEQSATEMCLFTHRKLKVVVTVHVDDPIVAGTREGIRMFFNLVGTELKVKENPEWSKQAQVFLGANFSRLHMQIDGVMKDVIIEGSKPGYFKNTLIQAGIERGSVVGTAGVKLETAVCGRVQLASPRRPDLLFTLKELGRGLAKTVLVHMPETAMKGVSRAVQSTSCGMIWWGCVLISSYARTQSTIATSSVESEYYGACVCQHVAVSRIGSSESGSRSRDELKLVTSTDYHHYDGDVAMRLLGSILLVSIATLVIAVCASMSWHQQQVKPQMCDASTQTDQSNARECSATRIRERSYDRPDRRPVDIYVYPIGQRYHAARECRAVTSARSHPR
eukprot:4685016-Amphidinium_carterae.1